MKTIQLFTQYKWIETQSQYHNIFDTHNHSKHTIDMEYSTNPPMSFIWP